MRLERDVGVGHGVIEDGMRTRTSDGGTRGKIVTLTQTGVNVGDVLSTNPTIWNHLIHYGVYALICTWKERSRMNVNNLQQSTSYPGTVISRVE